MLDIDRLLTALAHPTRRGALQLLRPGSELCLCELIARLGVGQSTMSRHMATLKDAGLVSDRRDAQWVRYRLNPLMDAQAERIVGTVLAAGQAGDSDRGTDHMDRSAA
jgi:ArsR family transcriptional regulator